MTVISIQRRGDRLFGKAVRHRGTTTFQQVNTTTNEVTVAELDDGHEMATTSYFLLAGGSLRGLYFRYEGVFPFGDLRNWIEREARAAVAEVRLDQGDEARSRANDDAFACSVGVLVRQENMDRIMLRWRALRGFQYTISTAATSAQTRGPLLPHTRGEKRTLQLDPSASRGEGRRPLVRAIMATYNWVKDEFGERTKSKLIGTDEHGAEVTFDLDQMVDVFDTIDVDTVITNVELQRPAHYDTIISRRMAAIADEHPELFLLPSQ